MKLISLLFFTWHIVRSLPYTTPFQLKSLSGHLDSLRHRLRMHFSLKRIQKIAKRLPGYIRRHDTTSPARLRYAPRPDYV